MYVVLVYDTAAERNPGVLRTCRKYLHWVQNSVFEGHLTPAQRMRLTRELAQRIDATYDRIRVYAVEDQALLSCELVGPQHGSTDDIL